MALDPRQRRFCDVFAPGLIERIETLGPGDFEPDGPELDCVGLDAVEGVALKLRYTMTDGMSVEIRSRWWLRPGCSPYVPHTRKLKPAEWDRYSYGMHYGHSFLKVVFRIDLDSNNGHHVHMRPNTDTHVPAESVEPDTRDMDAHRFIEMVAKYRRDKVYPLKTKRKRRP